VARLPTWVLGGVPLVIIALALVAFAALGGPGLGERNGPPVEELAVERTELRPGEIELTIRNTGPDTVTLAQIFVADVYVDFEASDRELGRLESAQVVLDFPWQEASPYTITLLSSTGATFEHTIDAAAETPQPDASFFALMALLGTYVGVIPVMLGMLFLPFIRRARESWIAAFMAVTVGLLAFLAADGTFEGLEFARSSSGAFGGVELVFLGAVPAYLLLAAVERYLDDRQARERATGTAGGRLAFMIALGIGLHNLGEGLAIGSAYSLGALALGAFLVVGFAIHNTTEGFAIVTPLARGDGRPPLLTLVGLGLLAGAPAIVGALIGASSTSTELSTFLIGVGVGAIVQVIVQLLPSLRDRAGRVLYPATVAGILAGIAFMYVTGLLVSA
jgi:zinc transporter, ZIP family